LRTHLFGNGKARRVIRRAVDPEARAEFLHVLADACRVDVVLPVAVYSRNVVSYTHDARFLSMSPAKSFRSPRALIIGKSASMHFFTFIMHYRG
jgi:hypothetical protein